MVIPAEVRLLLVDDMEEIRNLLRRLLTAMDGMTDFIIKPLSAVLLGQRLHHALENAPLIAPVANARLSLMSDSSGQNPQ